MHRFRADQEEEAMRPMTATGRGRLAAVRREGQRPARRAVRYGLVAWTAGQRVRPGARARPVRHQADGVSYDELDAGQR